jgi:hypothetical protein
MWLSWLALLSGAYPLWRAWRAEAAGSLRHAVGWLAAAWLGWLIAAAAGLLGEPSAPWRYLALVLSAGAGVAVLGARRPGVAAWNFVVAGLLAVLLLPLLEQPWSSPHWQVDQVRGFFLGAVLAVGVLNYLPTRLGLPATLAGAVFTAELWPLVEPAEHGANLPALAPAALAGSLWLAFLFLRRPRTGRTPFDLTWLTFRDRYGLAWGMRVREQFNNASGHAGWPVWLAWGGLHVKPDTSPPDEGQRREMLRVLHAVLKRFGLTADSAGLPATGG